MTIAVNIYMVGPAHFKTMVTNTASLSQDEAKMKMLCHLARFNNPPYPLHADLEDGRSLSEIWDVMKDVLKITTMTVKTSAPEKITLGLMVPHYGIEQLNEYPEELRLGKKFDTGVFHLLAQERADYLWEPFGHFRFKERKFAARAKLVYG